MKTYIATFKKVGRHESQAYELRAETEVEARHQFFQDYKATEVYLIGISEKPVPVDDQPFSSFEEGADYLRKLTEGWAKK